MVNKLINSLYNQATKIRTFFLDFDFHSEVHICSVWGYYTPYILHHKVFKWPKKWPSIYTNTKWYFYRVKGVGGVISTLLGTYLQGGGFIFPPNRTFAFVHEAAVGPLCCDFKSMSCNSTFWQGYCELQKSSTAFGVLEVPLMFM